MASQPDPILQVTSTHLAVQAVVDVSCPDCGCKKQELESECVGGHKEEGPEVGYGLQDAVDGVEGQPGKWGQRVLLVVDMVDVVQVPVPMGEHVRSSSMKIWAVGTSQSSRYW